MIDWRSFSPKNWAMSREESCLASLPAWATPPATPITALPDPPYALAAAGALSAGAEARADPGRVRGAAAAQRFAEIARQLARDLAFVDEAQRQPLVLGDLLGLGAGQVLRRVEDHDFLLLAGRERQRVDQVAEGVAVRLELGLVMQDVAGRDADRLGELGGRIREVGISEPGEYPMLTTTSVIKPNSGAGGGSGPCCHLMGLESPT